MMQSGVGVELYDNETFLIERKQLVRTRRNRWYNNSRKKCPRVHCWIQLAPPIFNSSLVEGGELNALRNLAISIIRARARG
jgi:hypothetical protein